MRGKITTPSLDVPACMAVLRSVSTKKFWKEAQVDLAVLPQTFQSRSCRLSETSETSNKSASWSGGSSMAVHAAKPSCFKCLDLMSCYELLV